MCPSFLCPCLFKRNPSTPELPIVYDISSHQGRKRRMTRGRAWEIGDGDNFIAVSLVPSFVVHLEGQSRGKKGKLDKNHVGCVKKKGTNGG